MRNLLFVPALALTACQGAAPPPSEDEPAVTEPPAEAAAPAESWKQHMAEHFEQGAAARDAVIAGDLAAAKAATKWLAEHEAPENHPDTWEPHLSEMRTAAKRAADANDIATAAGAVASVAAACGQCHQALHAGVPFTVGEMPPAGPELQVHMARHVWASERMWEGLIGPSDEAWNKAAEALTGDPITAHEHFPEGTEGMEAKEALGGAVHALGPEAAKATDSAARAPLYGKFIASCHECHPAAEPAPAPAGEPVGEPVE